MNKGSLPTITIWVNPNDWKEFVIAMLDLDYNATTPIKRSVSKAMEPFLGEVYGNPSSVHQVGQRPKAALEEARRAIAENLGTGTEELVLTASGSEANSFALRGYLGPPTEDQTIVTSPVEHSSIRDTVKWYENHGATVNRIPPTSTGQLDLDRLEEIVTTEVDLVTVMWVNNETGIEHRIETIGRICAEQDVPFHTDASQALGKRPVCFSELPADMLTLTAHKIGGPKGVGALLVPRNWSMEPLIFGGYQERERRGGTENVAGVVGFGQAIQEMDPEDFQTVEPLRDKLEEHLVNHWDAFVLGKDVSRVPNTTGVVIPGISGGDVVRMMDMRGIALATGSACTSGTPQPSHVVQALQTPDRVSAEGFVRISLPPFFNDDDLDNLITTMDDVLGELSEASTEEHERYSEFSPVPGA